MRFQVELWRDLHWNAERLIARLVNPEAVEFYDRILADAYEPEQLIVAEPEKRLIYITVQKVASTRIRAILTEAIGRRSRSLKPSRRRRLASLRGPRRIGVVTFHRLATNPATLRFAFVRNPYDRLVSCWADKFRDKPLVPGNPFVETYLASKHMVEAFLPMGSDRTLSFADFATYAAATNTRRVDGHWHLQSDIIDVPGLSLNFIGRFESLAKDLDRVFDHVGAGIEFRAKRLAPLNPSRRNGCAEYYTPEIADRVYRAYEQDFDRFGYSRSLPDR